MAIERRLVQKYGLQVAPWKRPVLLGLSCVIFVLCLAAAYFQWQLHFTSGGVWLVIAVFGVLSLAGIVAALIGNDEWVAVILGRV